MNIIDFNKAMQGDGLNNSDIAAIITDVWRSISQNSAKHKMESIMPIADYLTTVGFPFSYQRGSIRHYNLKIPDKGKEISFIVNVKRNQWKDNPTGINGGLCDHIRYYNNVCGLYQGIDERKAFFLGTRQYLAQLHLPQRIEVSPMRIGKIGVMPVNRNDRQLRATLSPYGISEVIISNWCQELLVANGKADKERLMLGFPTVNHQYYAFDGTCFRPIDQNGISIFGEPTSDQVCRVYDNPMDYLALRELWWENHVDYFFSKDCHLVINGDQNIKMAMDFLKDHPEFREVRSMLPTDDYGKTMFANINDACRGTVIDCSNCYEGHLSLLGLTSMQVPPIVKDTYYKYVKWKEKMKLGFSQQKHQGEQQSATVTQKSKQENKDKTIEALLGIDKEHLYGPNMEITLGERKERRSGLKL